MPDERSFAPLGTLPVIVLLLLGLPPLVFGGIRALHVHRVIDGLELAEGTILANEIRTSPDPEGADSAIKSYFPVVSFTAPDGASHQFVDATGTSQEHYAPGDTVEVLYDPRAPTRALLKSWNNTWQEPVRYLALGSLPLLILVVWAAWTGIVAPRRRQ